MLFYQSKGSHHRKKEFIQGGVLIATLVGHESEFLARLPICLAFKEGPILSFCTLSALKGDERKSQPLFVCFLPIVKCGLGHIINWPCVIFYLTHRNKINTFWRMSENVTQKTEGPLE